MLHFSTDDLSPQHRFDHWREVRGKSLFGVTIELHRAHRDTFHGRFSAVAVGGAVFSQMHASSYRISRTPADIARMPGDSLCIGLQARGPGWLDIHRGRGQAIRNGDLTISHSDQPFTGTPERGDGFDYAMLKIPLGGDMLLGAPAHDLFATTLRRDGPLSRPFAALFRAIAAGPRDAAEAPAAITHLARLAMLERGRLQRGMPEIRAALRAGYFHAALEILARDLDRPDLSPGAVARELGISPRHLHVLFEPSGRSFSRTLAGLRVARAGDLLRREPARRVSDIAFACGFDSLATFYRAFQASFGMTPADLRASAAPT
ncbi:helix-turn-helix transcriptional regulator [Azorhizobium doebereinerae]|uniref:helix-turn-helix transcriptional regulator n=1 Tax=Azorhizobium doebereinerae TaxID=281091 RepID=UPI0003FB5685|nr:AraC family transcriptional regulator [Azorhizobium doebereinerae]